MTVSSVSPALNSYQQEVQSPWKQRAKDFNALQSALQAGDLSGAQEAFAALQKDQPNSSQAAQASSASSQNSQGAKDFQALQSALSSGDLSGAQQAFASLKQDLQGAGRPGRHHHHHGGPKTETTPANQASSSASSKKSQGAQDWQALQTALSSGDLAGAQQAFAALKQDLQAVGGAGRHRHRHVGSVNSTTPAADSGTTTPAADSTSGTTAAQTVGSALDAQA